MARDPRTDETRRSGVQAGFFALYYKNLKNRRFRGGIDFFLGENRLFRDTSITARIPIYGIIPTVPFWEFPVPQHVLTTLAPPLSSFLDTCDLLSA